MSANGSHQRASDPLAAQFPEKVEAVDDVKAWELVDSRIGQYMPRRIRGSCRGRALG